MISIVDEGRRLTDLEAESRGGLMVSIDNQADLVRVLGLCLDLERPLESTPFITLPEESRASGCYVGCTVDSWGVAKG